MRWILLAVYTNVVQSLSRSDNTDCIPILQLITPSYDAKHPSIRTQSVKGDFQLLCSKPGDKTTPSTSIPIVPEINVAKYKRSRHTFDLKYENYDDVNVNDYAAKTNNDDNYKIDYEQTDYDAKPASNEVEYNYDGKSNVYDYENVDNTYDENPLKRIVDSNEVEYNNKDETDVYDNGDNYNDDTVYYDRDLSHFPAKKPTLKYDSSVGVYNNDVHVGKTNKDKISGYSIEISGHEVDSGNMVDDHRKENYPTMSNPQPRPKGDSGFTESLARNKNTTEQKETEEPSKAETKKSGANIENENSVKCKGYITNNNNV